MYNTYCKENYKALESIIKIKVEMRYRLKYYIEAGAYKPGELNLKDEIAVLVVDDKYMNMMSGEDLNLLKSKGIPLRSMIEFVKDLFETGESL